MLSTQPERSEFGRLCGLDTEEIAEFVEMCQVSLGGVLDCQGCVAAQSTNVLFEPKSNVFTPQSRQRSPA